MGNKRKKKTARFNKPGGLQSRRYKKEKGKSWLKLQHTLKGAQKVAYCVKSKKKLKVKLSKLSVNRARKFLCTRKSDGLKLTFHSLDTNSMPGNRILNLNELQKYVSEISLHSASCAKARQTAVETGAAAVKLTSEERNGFYTVLHSQCVCGQKFLLKNSEPLLDDKETKLHEINVRGVWGSMVSGGGCSSLEESMGTMGVPSVDQKQYSKLETMIGDWWAKVLEEDLKKAAEEEREHAIATGSYFQGVPAVTVICDGGWAKRSHKHTYNAMAGVGVIFGQHTGKLLHMGVRNRLCYICSAAENKKTDPQEHRCFKNWTESAQAMESDIIVEGFQQCEAKYGIRYMKVIADGDSSVYSNIQQQVPVWGSYVKKVECANHSCKCLRVHLERLVDDKPQYKGKGGLTKLNIQRIVTGVRCAIKMRSCEQPGTDSVKKLKQDIRNAGRHVLGLHDMCSKDFCKHSLLEENVPTEGVKEEEEMDEDVIYDQCTYWQHTLNNPDDEELLAIQKGGAKPGKQVNESLLKDVYFILNRTAEKSNRLVGNFTSNLAESWMHIRCKFDGGKMTNRCFRGSFLARCFGGSLRAMKGPAWSPMVYSQVTGKRADDVFLGTYRKRAKRYVDTRKRQATATFKKQRSKKKLTATKVSTSKKAKKGYGPEVLDDTEDISAEKLDKVSRAYYEKNVNVSEVQAQTIELQTRGQSDNVKWKDERRKRVTSSVFGEVMARGCKNNSVALTRRLLYTNFQGNRFTHKGLLEEENTRKEYVNLKSKEGEDVSKIDVPGLVISQDCSHLAASSDGIVTFRNGTTGLIEIKNLLQTSDYTIKEAAVHQKQFCLKTYANTLQLKRNHKYFYQIQGQLSILQQPWCDLIVRRTNPYDIFIERIYRDEQLWNDEMVPKLSAFYFTNLLPELSAPRMGTTTGIRLATVPWVSEITSIGKH